MKRTWNEAEDVAEKWNDEYEEEYNRREKIKKVESTRFYSGNLLNSIAKRQEAKFSPPVFIILSMFQT